MHIAKQREVVRGREVCKYHISSGCNRGDQCYYLHPSDTRLMRGVAVTQSQNHGGVMPAMPSFSNSSTPQIPAIDPGNSTTAHNATSMVTAPNEPILVNSSIVHPTVVIPETHQAINSRVPPRNQPTITYNEMQPQQRDNPQDMDHDERDDRPENHFVLFQTDRVPATLTMIDASIPPTSSSQTMGSMRPHTTPTEVPSTVLSPSRYMTESNSWGANRGRTSDATPTRETVIIQHVGPREHEIANPEAANTQAELL
jgi:hypothetical protein